MPRRAQKDHLKRERKRQETSRRMAAIFDASFHPPLVSFPCVRIHYVIIQDVTVS